MVYSFVISQIMSTELTDMNVQKEEIYTVDEIAKRLSVHPETVRNWIKNGQLSAINLGGSAGYRITESDLAEFLRKRRGPGQQDD